MLISPANPIRILLVDTHALVRAGLRLVIGCHPEFHVVGEVGDPSDALELARQEQPEIILFELDQDQGMSLEFIPQLLDVAQKARLLLVTGERDVQVHQRAAQLGAMGVVLKDQQTDVLIKAIVKVNAGEAWFDRSVVANVLTKFSRAHNLENTDPEVEKIATLSPREREIISLIGEGLKNQQIAERLFLSETTVRHHLTSIFSKLGVSDRLELIIYAYQRGLAQLPR
jgi:two-component system nitrate/nitrite response regulator NarL